MNTRILVSIRLIGMQINVNQEYICTKLNPESVYRLRNVFLSNSIIVNLCSFLEQTKYFYHYLSFIIAVLLQQALLEAPDVMAFLS